MSKQTFNPLSGNFDTVLSAASELPYDNTVSGLVATEVQEALDEIQFNVDNLPSPLTYKGTWDASTNTPTLDNTDTGVTGFLYQVSAQGTVDFGAGPILFHVGDKVVSNGTEWQLWDVTDAVTSVNSQVGDVLLDTDDVSEGVTNLYFSNTLARAAAVQNSLTASTVIAPSATAVNTALALKANTTLNNLGSTAVNVNIIPGSDNAINLGSVTSRYASAFIQQLFYDGTIAADLNQRILYNSISGNSIEFGGTTNTIFHHNLVPNINSTQTVGSVTKNLSSVNTTNVVSNAALILQADLTNVVLRAASEVTAISSYNAVVAPSLKFENKTGSFGVNIKALNNLAASYTLTLPVDDGTASQVLTTDGTGILSWTTPAAAGANTALSNLTTTSINADLLSDGGGRSIGGIGTDFNDIFLDGAVKNSDGTIAFDTASRSIRDAAEVTAVDGINRALVDTNGYTVIDFIGADLILMSDPNGATKLNIALNNAGDAFTTYLSSSDSMAANTNFVLPPDDGTSGYVLQTDGAGTTTWVATSTSIAPKKTAPISLSAGDITNQYYDLADVAVTDSIIFVVKGLGPTVEGASYDYSVSYTGGAGGNTRITFLNDLATGGASALIAADIIQVQYAI